jgi:teichuronic acid biosynthesis glycosyltransferase TuaC
VKLLFLSTAFPQPGDPARAPYNLRLCEALADGHDVTVVSPVPWTRRWSGRRTGAIPGVRYPAFVYPPGLLRSTHAWWMWTSIRLTARAVIEGDAPDAVISYWTWPDGAVAARLARSYGVPAVMIVGGSDVLVLAADNGHRRRVARTLAQADAVVTVGEHLRSAVAALGVPADRISVVRRGINRQVFSPASQDGARQRLGLPSLDALLLWVGRLSQVKGPDLLLDALEELASRSLPRWHCAIVGDGPLKGQLAQRVARGPLATHVSFLGTMTPADLAEWYRAADAVVLSSRSEGVPNVLYEARACGIPVVAMEAGDVAALIDEDDWLVPARDTEKLAAAIAEAIVVGGGRG